MYWCSAGRGNCIVHLAGRLFPRCSVTKERATFIAETSARLVLRPACRTDWTQGRSTSRAIALARSICVSAMKAELLWDVHNGDIVSCRVATGEFGKRATWPRGPSLPRNSATQQV